MSSVYDVNDPGNAFRRTDSAPAKLGGIYKTDGTQNTFTDGQGNKFWFADTTSANVSIVLPAATDVAADTIFTVIRTTAGSNTLTITTLGGTIDGASSLSITAQNDSYSFASDGTNYWIVNGRSSAGFYDTTSVQTLLANTTWTYGTVSAGDILRTRKEGFSYQVVSSGATDNHLVTAGGVKIVCLPTPDGIFNFAQMDPDDTGVADCWSKLDILLNDTTYLYPSTTVGIYNIGLSIYFPAGKYKMSATIRIKRRTTRLYGDAGSSGTPGTILNWPVGVPGIVIEHSNTYNGTTVAVGHSGYGSVIENLLIQSTVVTGPGGTAKDTHAIQMRATARVKSCYITDWGGNGVHIVAAAGSGGATEGNCNGWQVEDCFVVRCENGIFTDLADVNAGCARNVSTIYCRRWAIWDSSFLGNMYVNCEAADSGREVNAAITILYNTAYCTYGGDIYQLHPGAAFDAGISTTPGTDLTVWYPVSSGNFPQPWTGLEPSGWYRSGGAYLCDNLNAATVLIGCYTEGGQGQSWLLGPQLNVGGFMSGIGTYIGGSASFFVTRKMRNFLDSVATSGMITKLTTNESDGIVWNFEVTGGSTPTGTWRFKQAGDGWMVDQANSGSRQVYYLTGASDDYPFRFKVGAFVLGTGSTDRLVTRTTTSSGFPTSGTYAKGDIAFASTATAGNWAGWVCTTSGTGGSTAVFKEWGAIDV